MGAGLSRSFSAAATYILAIRTHEQTFSRGRFYDPRTLLMAGSLDCTSIAVLTIFRAGFSFL